MVILSSLCSVTDILLSVARPLWDGGLMDFVLKQVVSANSSQPAPTPMDHVFKTIHSGGFLAVLVFGVILSFFLLIVGTVLCAAHCRRKPIRSGEQKKRRLLCRAFHYIVSDMLVLIALFWCILAFIVNAHLHNALMSTDTSGAIFPRVSESLRSVQDYVTSLVPHVRATTEPIVEDIIHRSDVMATKYRTMFGMTLNERMHGNELKRTADVFMDNFTKIYNNLEKIIESEEDLSQIPLEDSFRRANRTLSTCCRALESTQNTSRRLLAACNALKKYYRVTSEHRYIVDFQLDSVSFEKAKTLVMLLKLARSTPASMKEQEKADKQKRARLEKRWAEASAVMSAKINDMIRNSSRTLLDGIEANLAVLSERINASSRLKEGHKTVAHYERIRNAVYSFVLLLIAGTCLVSAFVCTWKFCAPEKLPPRYIDPFKYLFYSSMFLASVGLLLSTATFVTGGYAYTEVCRYLEERPVEKGNHSALHLDAMVNSWLQQHWNEVKGKLGNNSAKSLLRPKDILYGMKTSCKENQSILQAIHLMNTKNTSALSNPEMTEEFLRMGVQSMHHNIKHVDPATLLRPKVKVSLERLALLLEQSLEKNYQPYIAALSKPIFRFNLSDFQRDVAAFKTAVKDTGFMANSDVSPETKFTVRNYEYSVQRSMENTVKYRELMDAQKQAFLQLDSLSNISEVIRATYPSIDVFSSFVNNKTKWLQEADALYEQYISVPTRLNSPKIVEQAFGNALDRIGRCRQLYDAYQNVVFATCTLAVRPLNLMWLLMGCSILFLIFCISMTLFILRIRRSDATVYYMSV